MKISFDGTSDVSSYSVLLIGDTHFDAHPESRYHASYSQPEEWLRKIQRAEFARNAEMWQDRCPRLIAAAAKSIRPDTAFALQLGDLVQGDCDDPAVHFAMMGDALEILEKSFAPLPVLGVVGNHDIRGKGAPEACSEFHEKWFSRVTGLPPTSAPSVRTIWIGKDAFVLVDFERVDSAALWEALDAASKARRFFLVTHGPLAPCDINGSRWNLFGRDDQAADREKLWNRLFAMNAIILAGHTHWISIDRFEREGVGSISQFVTSCVWTRENQSQLKPLDADLHRLADEARKRGRSNDVDYFEFFAKDLVSRKIWDGAGYATLHVSPEQVSVEFHSGASAAPAFRTRVCGGLRPLAPAAGCRRQ